jgi:hypothetical protein
MDEMQNNDQGQDTDYAKDEGQDFIITGTPPLKTNTVL